MKFSIWPDSCRTPGDLLAEVRAVEDAGWHGAWLADHYMPNTGDTTPARGDVHECWSLLPAVAAQRRAALIEACEKAGRDPATMRTSVNALIVLGKDAPPPGPSSAIAGSAQQLADQLGQYADLGFDEFILPDWNLGAEQSERADKIARIKAEILDQLPS